MSTDRPPAAPDSADGPGSTSVDAPPRPGTPATASQSASASGDGAGGGVPFAGLRLGVLVAALVALGFANLWMLIVIMAVVVMITLHEFGHYYMAKRGGMKVTEFFLGFGPKLWSIQRGETEYGIKLIPAGAYVKIPGMVNLDEVAPEDEGRTYRQKSFGARVGVAVAGSAMHFILALGLLYVALVVIGQPGGSLTATDIETVPVVETVSDGSGAAEAGLEQGDEIIEVDGQPTANGTELRAVVAESRGETVPVTVVRDGQEVTKQVPIQAYTSDGEQYCGIGIRMEAPQNERVGPVEGLVDAPKEFANIMWISAKGLGSFFSPSGISDFASQVGSAQDDRQEVTEESEPVEDPCAVAATASSGSGQTGENRILSIYGLVRFGSDVGGVDPGALIGLFALINIFIGMFNLVPLLPFDGGHVAIAVYEKFQEVRLHMGNRRYFTDVSRLLPLTYGVVAALAMLFFSSLYLDIVNPIAG